MVGNGPENRDTSYGRDRVRFPGPPPSFFFREIRMLLAKQLLAMWKVLLVPPLIALNFLDIIWMVAFFWHTSTLPWKKEKHCDGSCWYCPICWSKAMWIRIKLRRRT